MRACCLLFSPILNVCVCACVCVSVSGRCEWVGRRRQMADKSSVLCALDAMKAKSSTRKVFCFVSLLFVLRTPALRGALKNLYFWLAFF